MTEGCQGLTAESVCHIAPIGCMERRDLASARRGWIDEAKVVCRQFTERVKLGSCLAQARTQAEVTLLNSRNFIAFLSLFELHMPIWYIRKICKFFAAQISAETSVTSLLKWFALVAVLSRRSC